MADVPGLSRRHFLALASSSAALAAISCTTLKAVAKGTATSMSELTRLSAVQAVSLERVLGKIPPPPLR